MSTDVAGSKRSSDGGNWGGSKKARGDGPTLRFLLHSKHAGGIIGKGGETIKRLRSDFSAHVTVPDTNTGERVLTISAAKEQCVNVLKECLPLVHEPPYSVGGRGEPNPFEIDFLVLSGQVGGIIGKGGARIKQLREESNAKVKVYQDCLPDSNERVVALGGSEEEIVAALEQILEILENEPMKGNTTLYDPSYEHQTGFDSYNNNFGGPPGRGGGMGRGGGRGRGGSRGGGPGGNFGGPQGGGGYGSGGFGQDYGNSFGDAGNFGGNYGNTNNSFGNNDGWSSSGNFGNTATETTQVTVTNDMAGAIIGRGGERIRGIRQKSGADIKFTDSETDNKERLVTIKGSNDQIQHAQYLMQQCVRENHQG